jgi:hypothetical protein
LAARWLPVFTREVPSVSEECTLVVHLLQSLVVNPSVFGPKLKLQLASERN